MLAWQPKNHGKTKQSQQENGGFEMHPQATNIAISRRRDTETASITQTLGRLNLVVAIGTVQINPPQSNSSDKTSPNTAEPH